MNPKEKSQVEAANRVSLVDRVKLPEPECPGMFLSVTSSLFQDPEDRTAADSAHLMTLVQNGSRKIIV